MSDMPRDKLVANGGSPQTMTAVDLIVQSLSSNLIEHVGHKTHYGTFQMQVIYRGGQIAEVKQGFVGTKVFGKN